MIAVYDPTVGHISPLGHVICINQTSKRKLIKQHRGFGYNSSAEKTQTQDWEIREAVKDWALKVFEGDVEICWYRRRFLWVLGQSDVATFMHLCTCFDSAVIQMQCEI